MLYIQNEAFDAAGAERLQSLCSVPDFSIPNASYLVMQKKNVHIHRNIDKGAGSQNLCGPLFSFIEKIH